MIVMLGHLSNNRLAAGVDHIIYGWLFFGVVMALLFWIGSFWSESAAPAERGEMLDAARRAPATAGGAMYVTAIAAIAIAGIWRPMYVAFESPASAPVSSLVPVAAANGFAPVAAPPSEWQPSYSGFSATLRQGFASSAGAAGLYIAYYHNQAKGRELVTSGNQLVLPQDDKWKEVDRRTEDVAFAGDTVRALRIEVSGVRERLVVYRLFWVDGHVTGSEYVAKARIAWSRLRGRAGDAALIVTFAREGSRDAARGALEALSGGIKQALDATEVR
jgi:EpsI family protein